MLVYSIFVITILVLDWFHDSSIQPMSWLSQLTTHICFGLFYPMYSKPKLEKVWETEPEVEKL